MLNIDLLNPDPNNPRDITSGSLAGLRQSLELFGLVDLIIVNKRNMMVVNGNQRLKVFLDLGVKRVPCVLVDLPENDARLMGIAMNNDAICGSWTKEIITLLDALRDQTPEAFEKLRLQYLRNATMHLDIGAGQKVEQLRDQILNKEIFCPSCKKAFPEKDNRL